MHTWQARLIYMVRKSISILLSMNFFINFDFYKYPPLFFVIGTIRGTALRGSSKQTHLGRRGQCHYWHLLPGAPYYAYR
jgi:hypothetical protein